MWRFLLLSVVLGAAAIRARAQGAVRLGVGNQPCTAAPSGSGLPGDGLPFGCHADPAGPVPEVPEGVVPEPSAWFESFVLERQPLVLRGAVRGAPGVDGWTDDRLAGAEYGGLHVKLEGKREKRGETTAELVGKLAAGRDTLGHFVNRTRAWAAGAPTPQAEPRAAGADGLRQGSASAVGSSSLEGYVVSQLPDPMAADVLVPAVASCGSFARGLLEANLWVSSGNTSSMLHRDADNVLNCVYRGTKTWTLVDPVYTSRMPTSAELEGEVGGMVLVDPDRVTSSTAQGRQMLEGGGVPYRRVEVRAGDCLFLPWGYWHQVYSPPGRNVAVSLLFSVAHSFSDPDGECDKPASAAGGDDQPPETITLPASPAPVAIPTAPWLRTQRLSESDLLWRYDGGGDMSMGNADPASLLLIVARAAALPSRPEQLPPGTPSVEVASLLERSRVARRAVRAVTAVAGVAVDEYGEAEDDAGPDFLDGYGGLAEVTAAAEQGATSAEPNTWMALRWDNPEAEIAGEAAAAAAAALGIRPALESRMSAVLSRLERRLGRRLSAREGRWARAEHWLVGMGVPVPWGGVLLRGTFVRTYAKLLVETHGRAEGDDEVGWSMTGGEGDARSAEQAEREARAKEEAAGAPKAAAEQAGKRAGDLWQRRRAARAQARRQVTAAAEEEAVALWEGAFDPEGRGYTTPERALAVPRRSVARHLRVGMQFDPSNTGEWELYLQDGSAVTALLMKHWAAPTTLAAAFARARSQPDPARRSDVDEAAVDVFVGQAVAAGCGVVYAERFRQGYLEGMEGSDAVADRVVAAVVSSAAAVGDCGSGMPAPPPLLRPKRPVEGGDPTLPVPVMAAMGEDAVDAAVAAVASLFDRELKHDPALGDLEDLGFS